MDLDCIEQSDTIPSNFLEDQSIWFIIYLNIVVRAAEPSFDCCIYVIS